ncbi:MAG: oligopeptide/dipeptide ABC transporter ATP-binding protein [Burkholderiales bacterium]
MHPDRGGRVSALLSVRRLVKRYRLPRTRLFGAPPELVAVDGVDLTIDPGRSLGVVGESGSGKSTIARAVMALETPSAGTVELLGRDLNALDAESLRGARRDFQMVFQDPYGSLDPRQPVERIVAEPLTAIGRVAPAERRERVADVLASVGLRAADLDKYPHEFSGGQRQRIAIARALITRPKLIVADEPVSALDVSVQAQVLNLLRDLQDRLGLTYLLICHVLAVVDRVCDRVAVLLAGRVVEAGTPAQLFREAAHPYTRALLDAVPRADDPDRRRRLRAQARDGRAAARLAAGMLPADAPLQAGWSTGCAHAARCPHAVERCLVEAPVLRSAGDGRAVACHRADEVAALASPVQ